MTWPEQIEKGLAQHRGFEWETPTDIVNLLPKMVSKPILTLAWMPSWYASDQSLYRDIWAYYSVFLRVSSPLFRAFNDVGVDNLFVSDGMCSSKRYRGESRILPFTVSLKITEIRHLKIDDVKAIVWGNNQYLVSYGNDECLVLDDEENAGHCADKRIQPGDWRIMVTAETNPEEIGFLNEYYAQYPLPE